MKNTSNSTGAFSLGKYLSMVLGASTVLYGWWAFRLFYQLVRLFGFDLFFFMAGAFLTSTLPPRNGQLFHITWKILRGKLRLSVAWD